MVLRIGLTARTRLPLVVLTLSALAAIGLALPPATSGAGPAPSSIQLSAPSEVTIGQEIAATATLTSNGVPVTSRRLALYMDDVLLRTRGVDSAGMAVFTVNAHEVAVAHTATISVRFAGSPALAASQASAKVIIKAATLTIQTVPSVDGVRISVAGESRTTNRGEVSFTIPKLGTYPVIPEITSAAHEAMRADFVRWGDNVFTASRDVVVKGDTKLQLGVHIAFRGSFDFVDATGARLDQSKIQSVTLTSTGGTELTLTQYDDVWLEGGTAVKRADGLAEASRQWRVLEVMIAGTNVVNRGQQRVTPAPDAVWTVSVLLYDLTIEAHDAVFGGLLTGTVNLTFPDGSLASSDFGTGGGGVSFKRLPRGDYTVRITTAGLGAPTPVVLSRDEAVSIRVITYVDLAVGGALMLGVIAALVFLGRRRQVVMIGRRSTAWVLQSGRRAPRSIGRLRATARVIWIESWIDVWGAMSASLALAQARVATDVALLGPELSLDASWVAEDMRHARSRLEGWWRDLRIWFARATRNIGSILRRATQLAAVGVGYGADRVYWIVSQSWRAGRLLAHATGSAVPGAAARVAIATRRAAVNVSGRASEDATDADPQANPPVENGHEAGAVPRIAQTIPHTFEPSVPATVTRLIGSRRYMGLPDLPSRICPSCGRSARLHAPFCASCGARLPRIASQR